jgi:hypothetical protein
MAHVTKWATTRALISHDHKGSRTLAKTFADIRAAGLFAHGHQTISAQDAFNFIETGVI